MYLNFIFNAFVQMIDTAKHVPNIFMGTFVLGITMCSIYTG